jgi:hypothetical protein
MLQRGMNFRSSPTHTVVLMSQRKGAPYPDRLSPDGKSLYYVGHDAYGLPNKTTVDQPLADTNDRLTENGKFFQAVLSYQQDGRPELVRVYEKLHDGVWVFNGLFKLENAEMQTDGVRRICVFTLQLVEGSVESEVENQEIVLSPGRLIPTEVKLAVLKRDNRRCVKCGSTQDLHFDHIIPFSLGGSSTNAENIQLLCQRHNLEKSDRID